jgi:hypothetical protein
MKTENNPLTVMINTTCDPEIVKTFFLLKDEQRDIILKFINKITGLDYNIVRSDPENSCSPLLLCLGDVVIMHQWDV